MKLVFDPQATVGRRSRNAREGKWLPADGVGVCRCCVRSPSRALRVRFAAAVVLALVFCACSFATAQDDDDEPEPGVAQVQVAQFEIQENQFDAWIFQNVSTAALARRRLDEMLTLKIDDVDRACQLSEAQKKKLQLAARGDIVQFFEKVEVVRKKFLLVRKDQQKFNELWQDISPLQVQFQIGLFGDDSLYQKTLRNMLKGEQLSKFLEVDLERRKFQYRAKVELVVAMLENALPLRDEQRQKFINLIVEESKPPRGYGQQQDYYVVMWNISKIPEKKLKTLFTDTEWKVLNQQFQQVRGLEQWLKQSGILPKDGEAEWIVDP